MARGVSKAPPKPPARRAPRGQPATPPPERRRGGEARAIADLVPAVSGTAFRKFGFVQSAIVTRWADIAGARIARLTRPESLRFPAGKKADGVLRLTVTSAGAPMVQHVLPDLIAAVNQFFGYGAVAKIQLVQGDIRNARPLPRAAPPRSTAMPAPPAEPSPSLRAIGDPELRAVLEGLASTLANRVGPPKIS